MECLAVGKIGPRRTQLGRLALVVHAAALQHFDTFCPDRYVQGPGLFAMDLLLFLSKS